MNGTSIDIHYPIKRELKSCNKELNSYNKRDFIQNVFFARINRADTSHKIRAYIEIKRIIMSNKHEKLAERLASNWRNDDEDKVDELMKYFDISSQESHLLKLKSVMEKFNNALEMIFPKHILLNKENKEIEINEDESLFSNIWGLNLSSLERRKQNNEQIKKLFPWLN